MSSQGFSWIDWTILGVGILAIVWAVYNSIQKDKKKMAGADSQDYLFGKGEPWYIIGAAIFAANIGSEHLVGLAGTGAKDGVGMAHWEMQGWMILILGWLFVPFYQLLNNKLGKIITMPDFLKFRYTKRTGSWLSIITLIAYVFTKVSVTAFTGGIFFEFLLGLPFWYGALGLIFITAIFTVFGGMKGVMTLSAIQTPILIIGSFAVLFLGLAYLGGGNIAEGWTAMMDNAQAMHNGFGINHMFHFGEADANGVVDPLYKEYPGYVVFIGASIIGFWYWCTDQHIVQRVLGQRKGEDNTEVMKRARRGTIAAGFFKILPCFMFLIPGMIAIALSNGYVHDFTLLDPETLNNALKAASSNPESLQAITDVLNGIDPALINNTALLSNPEWIQAHTAALNDAMLNTNAPQFLLKTDASFAMMVKTVLPVGVKGIVTIGFICALVASLAAFFNSCATLFTEDFYKPMKPGKTEAHYVLVGRIATIVVVLLGLAWMPVMMSMDTLYSYLQNIQSLLAPAMVAVFTMGIFSKKITPKAGEWGLIGGFLIGMVRLITNVITDSGKADMTGWFWENTTWFWQTNWLIFEIWLLVFIIAMMVVVSFFTPAPTAKQIEAITFTGDYKKQIRNSWGVWDIVGTVVVIALCACFYAYFW
ncbi:MAG: sodium:solute symporter [Prevotella sp.]|nr:sodium:solute symporter [Prevotella sp.]